jgi:aquaporin Z
MYPRKFEVRKLRGARIHSDWLLAQREASLRPQSTSEEVFMLPKALCEFLGTFWLVLGGCGSAVLAGAFPNFGIGFVGVSLAFGLTVVTGAYAFGPISGGHFNPAVSVGLWAGGRFPARHILPYVFAQVAGRDRPRCRALLHREWQAGLRDRSLRRERVRRALSRWLLAARSDSHRGRDDVHVSDGDTRTTHQRAPVGFAGLAIGLALALIHLVSIPVTATSVNPARSTGPALFVGGWALAQLWLFWVAPIAGALLGGWVYKAALESRAEPEITGRTAP